MKRIFFADNMQSTPFQEGARRAALQLGPDIVITESAEDADVIIARTHYGVAEYFDLGRQYYVWTHEPSWSTVSDDHSIDVATGHVIHTSTPWNGDVYLDPLYFFPFYRPDLDRIRDQAAAKSKTCVVVATYRRKFDRYQGNVNRDLTEYRQRMAMGLHQKYDSCDIFGRNWPETIVWSGESRGAGWQQSKLEILKDYAFNLALENTLIENYVTEKLWDAYSAACVPIYYGEGSAINTVLSEGSYLDCSTAASVDELQEMIGSTTLEKRLGILESAVNDIEKINAKATRDGITGATVSRFVERIRGM